MIRRPLHFVQRWLQPALPCAALFIATAPALVQSDAAAQNPVRTLDIGGPPHESVARRCYSDSVLTAALAGFNSPTAVNAFGGNARIPPADTIRATYAVSGGSIRVDGTVLGHVIVFNGDVRVSATGSVSGDVIVLGGHLTAVTGARIGGRRIECDQPVKLERLANGTVAAKPQGRNLGHLASDVAVMVRGVRIAPFVGVGTYNRVEALPIQLGGKAAWSPMPDDSVHVEGYAVLRTARDPSGSRPAIGWHLSGQWTHDGSLPFTIGLAGGSTINATADRSYSAFESGLSALFLRRDYRDWYLWRGIRLTGSARLTRELTVTGGMDVSRETTVLSADAFSLLRGTTAWRPNPLIDDGKYRTLSAGAIWDARNEVTHPVFSWYARAEVRHVTSNDLTPVSLPTTIRDSLPRTGYGETETNFDLRGYLRLDPAQRIAARLSGAGYLSGDPLTIQNRRAINGADQLMGYQFRAINCDRRSKPDPATPALCDREMAIQAEYHHTLPIDLTTRVSGYTVGFRNPDLVLLADAGSAWLAGDSAGRVPANRIQALREWRSDVGVGITTQSLGLYLAKSLVDPVGIQIQLLFNVRF
jgi:hypothetical protein